MSDPSSGKHAQSPLARRWWLNLILLVVIAGLAVFAWQRSTHEPAPAKGTLTPLKPDAINRITIERAEQPTIMVERGDAGWLLTAPVKARADNIAMDSLLRIARAPIESVINPTDTELARYGLDRSPLRVRFNDTEIRFGDMHPLRESHYAQVGSSIYLVSSRYFGQAATKFNNLIDTRLIEPGRKPVALKLPGFSLIKKDGTWQRQPEMAELSSDLINAFVDHWQHARALQVDKASSRRATERVVVQFDDEPKEVIIGVVSRQPELILVRQDEGLEYRFPKETGERLFTLKAEAAK